ncbi:MAG: serine/threonine-protein kinase [Pseudoxanthomonas sp.]
MALELDLDDPEQREFGDYELIKRIGAGGMGLVYRARQRGLEREVAIKLLLAGLWASPEAIDRFRQEAQHAARLQHPGIVTIFEMGETDGLIHYAMQLVRGESLAMRLRERGGILPPHEAAVLVRSVAEAVAYAHSLGVLHLDLKPANVLIDADTGRPLVADFGLARRIEPSILPDVDVIAGTPGYMAPEQAQPGAALGATADVWALGAMLHELLGGGLSRDNEADVDGYDRFDLPDRVPADLRAICGKCLAPVPASRYAGARELADDLGRFLEGRAVAARPLTPPQRLLRWARREPRMAFAIGFAAMAVFAGLSVSLWMWQRAERSSQLAQEVNRFLNEDVLAGANPDKEFDRDGSQITISSLLANAESKLDGGLILQPVVRAQTGLSIGRAYFGLGLWERALPRLQKAREDAAEALGDEAALTLDIEQQLGQTLTYTGDYDAAQSLYRHLLAARRRLSGPDSPATISARQGYAALLFESDRFEESALEYEAIQVAATKNAPEQLIDIDRNLADLYAELNRWDDAENLLRNVLDRSRKQFGTNNTRHLWHVISLIDLLNMRAKWDEASLLASDTRAKLIDLVGHDHPKTLCAIHYLGQIELARGHPQQALPLLQEALRGRAKVHGESHKYTQYTMNRVGEALLALDRPQESVAMLEHALDLATQAGRREQPYVLLILDNLARAHMALGQMDQAERYVEESLASVGKSGLPAYNLRRGMVESVAGDLRARQGRYAEARTHYARALAIYGGGPQDGLGEQHPWLRDLRARMAALPMPPPSRT